MMIGALAVSSLYGCSDDDRGRAHDASVPDAADASVNEADASDSRAPHDAATEDAPTDASAVDAADASGDAALAPIGLPYPIRWGARQSLTHACGIAADPAGNVYVVGQTTGSLWPAPPLGRRDLFLARVRKSGALEWVRQLGDAGTALGIFTSGCAVAVGAEGEAYVAGTVNGTGTFQGQPVPSVYAGFAARFDKQGTQRWVRLIGEAPGPTETMAIDVHANEVNVLGWTQASLNGQPSRGQGDAVLIRLAADTGTAIKTLRFGSATEDLPMGLVRDAAGLWVGFRSFQGRSTQPVRHELVHLGPQDTILDQLAADAEAGFAVLDFSVTSQGDVVVLGGTTKEELQGYAFRVHQADGSLGPIVPGALASSLQTRAFVCGRDGCAVAGQVLEEPTPGSEEYGVLGFVHLFTPQLHPSARATIAGEGGGGFTTVAALAPAPAGHWYAAGWSNATVWEQPPLGNSDGLTFRLSPQGEVANDP